MVINHLPTKHESGNLIIGWMVPSSSSGFVNPYMSKSFNFEMYKNVHEKILQSLAAARKHLFRVKSHHASYSL